MDLTRTKFFSFILFTMLFTALLANAQTPKDGDDRVETILTEEVKLNISAFDDEGKVAPAVSKADLVIMEDGRIIQANSVRRIPANVLIVLDTGGELRSSSKNIDQTRATAASLVNILKQGDAIALLEYNDKAEIFSEWTTDKKATLNALDKQLNFGKRSLFVDALELATKFLQKNPLENKHLVLITDGTDALDRNKEKQAAIKNLLATNISVHVISYTQLEQAGIEDRTKAISGGGVKSKPLPPGAGIPIQGQTQTYPVLTVNLDKEMINSVKKRGDDLAQSQKELEELSRDTNGEFILPATTEEMKEKTELIARMIDSTYVVTFTPKRPVKGAPKDEIRQVSVTSKRAGLDVQAKRKIIAPASKTKQ